MSTEAPVVAVPEAVPEVAAAAPAADAAPLDVAAIIKQVEVRDGGTTFAKSNHCDSVLRSFGWSLVAACCWVESQRIVGW
jgi:hypothetical protein